nr:MAG TPA: hypothetical protein [Inoviridae sp.]
MLGDLKLSFAFGESRPRRAFLKSFFRHAKGGT